MSEMDIRELIDRITAMSKEEQLIAIRNLPSQLMIDELADRYNTAISKLERMDKVMREL